MTISIIETKTSSSSGKRVLKHLRELIEDGTFPAGQSLPSERILAEKFGVTRNTIHDAVLKITADGLLRSNGGRLRIVTKKSERNTVTDQVVHRALEGTIVLVGNNPRGVAGGGQTVGTANWVDQGVMEAAHETGLHYLALNPAVSIDSATWEKIAATKPMAIIMTDIMAGAEQAYAAMNIMERYQVPVIAYGNRPSCASFDRVDSDQDAGAYMVARWLIERGAKRILQMAVSDPETYWFKGRRSGYERALTEENLPVLPALTVPDIVLPTGNDRESRIQSFDRLRRHYAGYLVDVIGQSSSASRVDAIMAVSDSSALAIAGAGRLLGRLANQDFLLAGYDNQFVNDDLVKELEPLGRPVVNIDKQNFSIGTSLVQMASDRAGGRLPPTPQLRSIEPRLITEEDATSFQ